MVSAQLSTRLAHFPQNLDRAMYTNTLPNTNTRLNVGRFEPHQAFSNRLAMPLANGTRTKGLLELSGEQDVQSLQVEGQAQQTPFTRYRRQAAQRELSKAQYLPDDANHRLNG